MGIEANRSIVGGSESRLRKNWLIICILTEINCGKVHSGLVISVILRADCVEARDIPCWNKASGIGRCIACDILVETRVFLKLLTVLGWQLCFVCIWFKLGCLICRWLSIQGGIFRKLLLIDLYWRALYGKSRLLVAEVYDIDSRAIRNTLRYILRV